MRLYLFLLSALFAGTALAQSSDPFSDPFIGTWVYSAEKSPEPTITYAIKDLGGDRYALTGSTGETTEIKAGGASVKSPSGDQVSFKKLDAHTWHMDRVEQDGSGTMSRTYALSADDSELTLTDVYTGKAGIERQTVTKYHRTSPGKSIYGMWRSYSAKSTNARPPVLVIERFGKDGLTFKSLPSNQQTDMFFDGKPYTDRGPNGAVGTTSSGKRSSAHLLQLQEHANGAVDETDEYKVSDDGKTLTIVAKAAKTSAIFTSVWERK